MPEEPILTAEQQPAPAPKSEAEKAAERIDHFLQDGQLTIASSPHFHHADTTRTIMLDVVIALLPALVAAVYFFGLRALLTTCVSVLACIFFEWGYRKVMKKDSTWQDCSCIVTGMLIAMVCPVSVPYWMLIIGDFFAIVIVKQLFGGIGKNFMNPALSARAFLFSWAATMTTWYVPGTKLNLLTGAAVDAVTSATPLGYMHTGSLPANSLMQVFVGNCGGCIGETSAMLLILGGVYLVVRKVISPRIPLVYVGTVAVLSFLFPQGGAARLEWMLYSILSGGLMLGAIFMATDYTTSPVTKWGQVLYAVGCGGLTILIRYFGGYPEGVSYSILIMNACVYLLDKIGRKRRFGLVKAKKGGASA